MFLGVGRVFWAVFEGFSVCSCVLPLDNNVY